MKLPLLLFGILFFSVTSYAQELAYTQWGDTLVTYENGTWENIGDVLQKVKSVKTSALDSEYGAYVTITLASGVTKELFSGKYTSELIVQDENGQDLSDYFIDGETNDNYADKMLYISYIIWSTDESEVYDVEIIEMHL